MDILLRLAVVLSVLAVVGFFGLRWFERSSLFFPERYRAEDDWRTPPGGAEVAFMAAGSRLHGWFVPAIDQPALGTILHLHGNGGNVRYRRWVYEAFCQRGYDVLLFDYRGYGRSEGTLRNETDLFTDAQAAYDYLVNARRVDPARLALWGQSIGTTAAVDLAARNPCGALIIESGLSSASAMASEMLPWLPRPLHRLGVNRLDNLGKLPGIHCPVLVVHGDQDRIIPTRQGEALFAAANEPKQWLLVPGAGHNDVAAVGGEGYLEAVAGFLRAGLDGS